MNPLAKKMNAYLAVLLITIAGGGAALLIVHIASVDSYEIVESGHAEYRDLLN